jgi:CubicO group peptidase (beta-lactamase class C family)
MAAAGLWTTPTDLARFLLEMQKALRGESALLTAETARQMTTVVKEGYGLGLGVHGTGAAATFGHGGSNAGFKCQMVAFIDKGQGAVVMTNGDQGSRLAQEVLRSISREYGWPIFKSLKKTAVAVAPDVLAALTGRYEMRPGKTILVSLEGATLFVIDGDERIELYPESGTRFFELAEETSLEFVTGADGKVTHVMIDGRIKAPRVGER